MTWLGLTPAVSSIHTKMDPVVEFSSVRLEEKSVCVVEMPRRPQVWACSIIGASSCQSSCVRFA